MIVVVWGVSGCGKSTVGQLLAQRQGWLFYDADDYHPAANVEKMRSGVPLTDEDRWPWLDKLANLIASTIHEGGSAVLACSALKQAYRDRLRVDSEAVRFVHLQGTFELIQHRLEQREHAFMNSNLLTSQFATLQTDPSSLALDVALSPEEVCVQIEAALELA